MPNTAYVQQVITIKQQQNPSDAKHSVIATITFAQQMRNKIYAEQLRIMQHSLGV